MTEDEDLTKFRTDVSKFSGNYSEFLVIAKTPDGRLYWRSTDQTWAIGAANRYLNCIDEIDRDGQRSMMREG